ncbi:MAG: VOC family protein [Mycobacteriales bacterium]|nr:VOC family protein [Frankia sp.]
MQGITPCLWFDDNAEEAIEFYGTIFPNLKVHEMSRYGEGGPGPAGQVMAVTWEMRGLRVMAINGGPQFPQTEAFSLMVQAESQDEADELWAKLTADGGEEGQCGWCKDKYGVSWQIVPAGFFDVISDPDPQRAQRAMTAMLKMRKLDIAALRRAADGKADA